MGEIADDAIDRMLDDLFEGRGHYAQIPRYSRSSYAPRPKKPVKVYPEKTFDMGFFPTMPKQDPRPEPRKQGEKLKFPETPKPDPWASDEEAPF